MIYIVRHGQTDWNVKHITQGQTDTKLNSNGIKQAKEVSEKISNLKIDRIISSDLARTYMTAQIINEKFNKVIEKDKRLREFNYGKLEGISRDEITQEMWEKFNENPKKFNAETPHEIFDRIKSFIDELKDENLNTNFLIVTHGGPIRMIDYYLNNGNNFDSKQFLEIYADKKINNLELFTINEKMKFEKYAL